MQGDRGLNDDLAPGQAAQADQRTLAGRDRAARGRQEVGEAESPPGLCQGVGDLECPGNLEFGRQAPAIIRRSRRQGRLGQVDRPALAGRRPLRLRPAGRPSNRGR